MLTEGGLANDREWCSDPGETGVPPLWKPQSCKFPLEYLYGPTSLIPWTITQLPSQIQCRAIISPPAKRHLKGVSQVGPWWPVFITMYCCCFIGILVPLKQKIWIWIPPIHETFWIRAWEWSIGITARPLVEDKKRNPNLSLTSHPRPFQCNGVLSTQNKI